MFQYFQMKTPAIQNDFSYYRRIVSRGAISVPPPLLVSEGGGPGSPAPPPAQQLGVELANRITLFYAHATPMLKVLSEATSQFVADNQQDLENTTETLGTMAKVCLRMLENP